MTDQAKLEAGARLAGDLRRIRELRNMSIEDLHAETKIPRGLLKSFEEKALFDHSQFNRVYLRSFVRTYAGSIGVPPEKAADALETAFEGQYEGELGREYGSEGVGAEEEQRPEEPPFPVPGGTTPDQPAGETEEPPSEEPVPRSDQPSEGGNGAPPRRASPEEEPAGEEAPADPDWMASSPPSRKPVESSRKRVEPQSAPRPRSRRQSGSKGWLLAIVGLVVVGLLVWLFVSVMSPSGDVPAESETIAAAEADTAAVEEEPQVERPAPTLGDSLVFYVVAADGPVAPIRVTVDDDLRRPYWIEEGDSMRFAASERIVFEDQLDVVELNLQDFRYPTDQRDDQGRIVVTRDSAQAFLEEQVES